MKFKFFLKINATFENQTLKYLENLNITLHIILYKL